VRRVAYRLFLLGLTEGRRCPSDDDGVDRVGTHWECKAGCLTARCVHCASRNDESDDGNE